jgi:IS30 family transposase
MSSRRVPKGPGRRPMSQKRRQFVELLANGWSLSAACRELGIGRSTGHIWKNGTVVRRKDGTVKVVPPLEPLAVRTISPRFLSEQERIQIADLASRGHGPTAIGKVLGRSPSTISRELRRNLHASGQYRPFHAHAVAATRRRRTHPLKLRTDPVLHSFVIERLRQRWSPAADQPGSAIGTPRRSRPPGRDRDDLSGDLPPWLGDRPKTSSLTASHRP